jgi:hypothetical protein
MLRCVAVCVLAGAGMTVDAVDNEVVTGNGGKIVYGIFEGAQVRVVVGACLWWWCVCMYVWVCAWCCSAVVLWCFVCCVKHLPMSNRYANNVHTLIRTPQQHLLLPHTHTNCSPSTNLPASSSSSSPLPCHADCA